MLGRGRVSGPARRKERARVSYTMVKDETLTKAEALIILRGREDVNVVHELAGGRPVSCICSDEEPIEVCYWHWEKWRWNGSA